jgi:S-adenosylmethionine synthetase
MIVEGVRRGSSGEQKCEVVERKGLGHPDSITDAVMEHCVLALSREYKSRFGTILHHNLDKGLLVGGSVERRFGGGRVVEPMRLILGDRATFALNSRAIPVNEIVIEAAKNWFRSNLRFVDPDKHVKFQSEIRPGSTELRGVFARKKQVLGANDTSAGVGYAPLTQTESIVLETELYLNSGKFKALYPETGEDVKIMAIREGRDLYLTIAMPLLDRFVESERAYFHLKDIVHDEIRGFARARARGFKRVEVTLNALDRKRRGSDGIYLSVLGTSAEDADSGQVGRGNRVNGLISFNRPCSLEAAAGKNAVSHVGKIYNILAHRMAHTIYENVNGIEEVTVWLVSRIGTPIDQPAIVSTRVLLKSGVSLASVSRKIKDTLEKELGQIGSFCEDLLAGKYPVM